MGSNLKLDGIEVGLATVHDAVEMVNFHNAYYRTQRTPNQWIWEWFTHQPDKTVFVFARHQGQLIATVGRIPLYLRIGGERVLSGKGESLLCLPAYRGTGLMTDLAKYAQDMCRVRGMECTWGFGYLPRAFVRQGVRTYSDIKSYGRQITLWNHVTSRIYSNPVLNRFFPQTTTVGAFRSLEEKQAVAGENGTSVYRVEKGEIPIDDMAGLCERLTTEQKHAIHMDYSQNYLSWRFRKHPFLKYEEYRVYDGVGLRAYAILVVSGAAVFISDFLSEDQNATSALLSRICTDYAGKSRKFHFLANSQDNLQQDTLKQLGRFGFFIDEKISKSWQFHVWDLTGKRGDHLFDISNWHITGLWSEGYQF